MRSACLVVPDVSLLSRSMARSTKAVLLSPVRLAKRSTLLTTTGFAICRAMTTLLNVDLNMINILRASRCCKPNPQRCDRGVGTPMPIRVEALVEALMQVMPRGVA